MSRRKARQRMARSPRAASGSSAVRGGSPRDVEALKRALRESEARYRRILDAVTDYAYAVRCRQGKPVDTRHGVGCVHVTGYHPGDFETDSFLWINIVHPEDRDAVLEHAASVLRDDVLPLEHRILHRDGSTRWVCSTIIRHIENGDLVRYDGILRDITKRRRIEQALRENEVQLCGLSNISFGLPERKFLNQTFMVMAIARGLDGAIVDPLDKKMMANIIAAEALAGNDEWCSAYLEAYRAKKFEF